MKLPFVWELKYDGITSHAVGTMHCVEDVFRQDAKKHLAGKEHLLAEAQTEDATLVEQLRICAIQLGSSIDKLTRKEKIALELCTDTDIEILKKIPTVAFPIYLMQRAGYENLTSIEQTFADITHIPPKSLESVDLISLEAQLRDCTKNLRKLIAVVPAAQGSALRLFQTLYTAYKKGDEKKVAQLSELDADEEDRLAERNKTMVDNSLKYLQQPSIILAGAAHFVVEPSMIMMYKEKGIEVKRVQ